MVLASSPDSPLVRRLATLSVGMVLVATGVASMIRADLGVAPYDVLTTGLAEATGLEIGLAAMLNPMAFTLLGWAMGRRPGAGTVLTVLCIGPILGLVLRAIPAQELLAIRFALFAFGFLCVAAGITAVIIAELGPGPAELVMLALHDRGRSIPIARTVVEISCVGIGWVLGGQVGAGTVLVAVLTGPILKRMLRLAGYPAGGAAPAGDDATAAGRRPSSLDEVVDTAAPGV